MPGLSEFFSRMSPIDWEHFAVDFLVHFYRATVISSPNVGPDQGKDAEIMIDNIKYIVSCKYSSDPNAVIGDAKELDVSDRISRHGAGGFIGFYFANISHSLQDKFNKLSTEEKRVIYFDRYRILDMALGLPREILMKYNLINSDGILPQNVLYAQIPLPCMFCGKNIIEDSITIHSSMAAILPVDGVFEFLYGCKSCIVSYQNIHKIPDIYPWAEVYQLLFREQHLGFWSFIQEYLQEIPPSAKFYHNMSTFFTLIQQRAFSPEFGRWLE